MSRLQHGEKDFVVLSYLICPDRSLIASMFVGLQFAKGST